MVKEAVKGEDGAGGRHQGVTQGVTHGEVKSRVQHDSTQEKRRCATGSHRPPTAQRSCVTHTHTPQHSTGTVYVCGCGWVLQR